jgi:NAD(P)-dependent dehydrogenase (short-subunit alcohol dehydrogenase family)
VGQSALPAGTYDGVAVFVTGAGTGLGKAMAAEFARLGASIVIASRKEEHLAAGREAIEAVGSAVETVTCDIRDPDAIAAAFDAAETAFGLPQVLINNAAANFPVPAEDMSPNAWRTVVDITLNGTFFCAREFGRRHLAAGTPGSIVNVGASYAWTGGPGFAHSAAAKAGVKNMTETLAVEWGPYGIQVNALVPGLFPHEDMTADIQGNLERTHDKDDCQPALLLGLRK